MLFTPTELPGVWLIDLELRADERGFFARTWCAREAEAHGLAARLAQCNLSFNPQRGTLRGLHYQAAPYAEAKLVRCTRGALWDVAVDLRPASPSYKRWTGVELTADNRRALYIPFGCAHGFLSLADETEVVYQMSEFYVPEAARGVRWDDPAFGIRWPAAPAHLSARDASYPDWAA